MIVARNLHGLRLHPRLSALYAAQEALFSVGFLR
jgi:hypothetical protein